MNLRDDSFRSIALGALLVIAWTPACSGDQSKGRTNRSDGGGGDSAGGHDAGSPFGNSDGHADSGLSGAGGTGSAGGTLVIEPQSPVVHVVDGNAQTLDFSARIGGRPVQPVWSISRAELGAIDKSSGHYTSGMAGGSG